MAVDGVVAAAAQPSPDTRLLDGVVDRALSLLHICNYDVPMALQLWRGDAPQPSSVSAAVQELAPTATADLASTFIEGARSAC